MIQYKNLKKGYKMKLKFVLVPLVVLGVIGGCSSPKKSIQNNGKWITPSNSVFKNNGGEIFRNVPIANWENAKKICSASGGHLPSIDELIKVVTDCGGVPNTNGNGRYYPITSSSYENCLKRKGFNSYDMFRYWSKTTNSSKDAWLVNFKKGIKVRFYKFAKIRVRCIRNGQ